MGPEISRGSLASNLSRAETNKPQKAETKIQRNEVSSWPFRNVACFDLHVKKNSPSHYEMESFNSSTWSGEEEREAEEAIMVIRYVTSIALIRKTHFEKRREELIWLNDALSTNWEE